MQQPGKGFLVWLAGLSVLGFLATDMYLPAFAAMQQDLNTSRRLGQRQPEPVPGGLCAWAALLGPISDRYGRKPVLLSWPGYLCCRLPGDAVGARCRPDAGAALYPGSGVCAAAVTWQAMVTDYYPAQRTNRIFATIMPLVGLSPALAPPLAAGCWFTSNGRPFLPFCSPLPYC